jgi:hypothetical protein
MAFSLCRTSRADNSDPILFEFYVRHDDEFAVECTTQGNESFLSNRVLNAIRLRRIERAW